jgi:hypothetical protein
LLPDKEAHDDKEEQVFGGADHRRDQGVEAGAIGKEIAGRLGVSYEALGRWKEVKYGRMTFSEAEEKRRLGRRQHEASQTRRAVRVLERLAESRAEKKVVITFPVRREVVEMFKSRGCSVTPVRRLWCTQSKSIGARRSQVWYSGCAKSRASSSALECLSVRKVDRPRARTLQALARDPDST